jgi:hypothetical protein
VSIRVQYFDRDGNPTRAEYATREEAFLAMSRAFRQREADSAVVLGEADAVVERWEPSMVAMCVWEAKS